MKPSLLLVLVMVMINIKFCFVFIPNQTYICPVMVQVRIFQDCYRLHSQNLILNLQLSNERGNGFIPIYKLDVYFRLTLMNTFVIEQVFIARCCSWGTRKGKK